jgi:hypothetical protein
MDNVTSKSRLVMGKSRAVGLFLITNRPARAVLGDMTSSRGHRDDDSLWGLLRGMEKMRPHEPISMSSTGYEIHIHELSRLCHITVVWVSSQEVTRHQDGPCYWSCIGEGSAASVFHPPFIGQNALPRVLTHRFLLYAVQLLVAILKVFKILNWWSKSPLIRPKIKTRTGQH